ncbi:MAG: carboxypeptidase-like regulatory domain-containing protein, partial [Mariniphaga sp.]
MEKLKSIFIVLFVLGFLNVSAQQEGIINGFVRDVDTQSPLINVTVRVIGSDFVAVTDSMGFYRIKQLPTKAWTVEASALGYKGSQKFDIPVTAGNASEVNFELQESSNELAQVEVKANFFKPAGAVNSIQSLGINEIAKYPGANFDMAKVVQSLPGVSGSVGFRNDIIIRGGAPNENVYFLDGIEIPSINHFATQGASGGPVGLLNVSFIESVTLHTSAFPAKYDNPLSGVLVFKQRTGNSQRVQSNFRLSASEAAFTTEGPLGKKGGATTFIGSVRRSYLKLIFQLIDLPF